MSLLDKVVKRLIITNFFGGGWGDPEHFTRILNIRSGYAPSPSSSGVLPGAHPRPFQSIPLSPDTLELRVVADRNNSKSKHYNTYHGSFLSPLAYLHPESLPEESVRCNFVMILPKQWRDEARKRVCLQYAATGDHGYWRRARFIGQPLAKESGIGSVIVENPFYGSRKPKHQVRSGIRYVSDLFTMGCALVLEGHFIMDWLREEEGYTRLGISGVSLGGHNASLAAAAYPKPIAVVPCLSWSTAAHTFSEGIISSKNMWRVLREQLCEDKIEEIKSLIRKTDQDIEEVCRRKYGHVIPAHGALTPSSSPSPYSHVDGKELVVAMPPAGGRFSLSELKYVSRLSTGLESLTSSIGELRRKNSPDNLTTVYLRLLLDEFSNLNNYPVPVCERAAIVVVAEDDLYVTRPSDVPAIGDIWRGCEVRRVRGGHVSSFILHNATFRRAIVDAFDNLDRFIEAGVAAG